MSKETSGLDLNTIKEIAADIASLSFQTKLSLEEAAKKIESEMDGTQPSNLISQSLNLAIYQVEQVRAILDSKN